MLRHPVRLTRHLFLFFFFFLSSNFSPSCLTMNGGLFESSIAREKSERMGLGKRVSRAVIAKVELGLHIGLHLLGKNEHHWFICRPRVGERRGCV